MIRQVNPAIAAYKGELGVLGRQGQRRRRGGEGGRGGTPKKIEVKKMLTCDSAVLPNRLYFENCLVQTSRHLVVGIHDSLIRFRSHEDGLCDSANQILYPIAGIVEREGILLLLALDRDKRSCAD